MKVKGALRFLKGRLTSPSVGDEPGFASSEAIEVFKRSVGAADVYLEYGSGGSTVWAARAGKAVVTVESDAHFLNAVRRKLVGSDHRATLLHGDIGPTQNWGKPIFTRPTAARRVKWANYVRAPWERCAQQRLTPDVVLVDGRFRAAAILTSLLLNPNREATILVDDYGGRPHYHVVERFAELRGMAGDMAIFKAPADLDRQACAEFVDELVLDYR